eukprot:jgi/Galph1/5391/GphlegSOOS_G4035.1
MVADDNQWLHRLRIVRELWFLREQARVRAVGQEFLQRLEQIVRQHASQAASAITNNEGLLVESLVGSENRSNNAANLFQYEREPASDDDLGGVNNVTVQGLSENRQSIAGTHWENNPLFIPTCSTPESHLRLSNEQIESSSSSLAQLEDLAQEYYFTRLRADSRDHVQGQHVVSNTLESTFREELERLLRGRLRAPGFVPPQVFNRNEHDMLLFGEDSGTGWNEEGIVNDSLHDTTLEGNVEYLKRAVQVLQRDVASLRNIVNASFDIQLDVQRAIRQELSGTLNMLSSKENNSSHITSYSLPRKDTVVQGTGLSTGLCVICTDAAADSLLYRCGHLCTCALCGRQLIATGQPCPICRAPIHDVIRAYTTEME